MVPKVVPICIQIGTAFGTEKKLEMRVERQFWRFVVPLCKQSGSHYGLKIHLETKKNTKRERFFLNSNLVHLYAIHK